MMRNVQNRLQHASHIAGYLAVPKADYAVAERLKLGSSIRIISGLIMMLAAIELNDKMMAAADKIADIWTDRNLS